MNTTRRALVLIALVAGVLFASGAAAQAFFLDSVMVTSTPMSVSTATVAAPAAGPGSLTCRSRATMALTWTKSTSARVSGYLVTVYFSDGYRQTVQMTADDTAWSQTVALYNVTAYSVRYTVTTQTDAGWTKESTSTGWFRC